MYIFNIDNISNAIKYIILKPAVCCRARCERVWLMRKMDPKQQLIGYDRWTGRDSGDGVTDELGLTEDLAVTEGLGKRQRT